MRANATACADQQSTRLCKRRQRGSSHIPSYPSAAPCASTVTDMGHRQTPHFGVHITVHSIVMGKEKPYLPPSPPPKQ